MRILWLTIDRSVKRVKSLHFYQHMKAVSELNGIEVVSVFKDIGEGGISNRGRCLALLNGSFNTGNILSDILSNDSNFDFIICDAFFAFIYEDWRSVNIPTAIFIVDVHGPMAQKQIKIARDYKISTIFHRFNEAFYKLHPYTKDQFNCIWLPHSINMGLFEHKVNKTIEVLHTGVYAPSYYPLRYYAIKTLTNKPYFQFLDRKKFYRWPGGSDYVNLIKSAKIHITDSSIFNTPVCKFVEIPAANTLLMSDWFSDLEKMGFIDGKNMVAYTKSTLVTKVEGLLKKPGRILKISAAGHRLVKKRHNSVLRAEQFINHLNTILGRPPYAEA